MHFERPVLIMYRSRKAECLPRHAPRHIAPQACRNLADLEAGFTLPACNAMSWRNMLAEETHFRRNLLIDAHAATPLPEHRLLFLQ